VWTLLFICLAFLVTNLATAERYPCVWIDEVMFADPAVRLVAGQGWTSSSWYIQDSSGFWAGNAPLHSLALVPWISIFGESIRAVRSINYVLILMAVAVLWLTARRVGITKPALRLLLVVVVLTSYAVIFGFRSGRSDPATILLMSLLAFGYFSPPTRVSQSLLLVTAVLIPWAGLQLLPLIAALTVLAALVERRAATGKLAVVWLGVATGVAALLLFFLWNGVLGDFVASVTAHTAGGSNSFLSSLLKGRIAFGNRIPKDFSAAFLFGGSLATIYLSRRAGHSREARPLVLGVALAFLVAFFLLLVGKFPTYYGWMISIPLAMALCVFMSRDDLPSGVKRIALLACLGSIFVGLAPHTAAAVYNWDDRDYEKVRSLVSKVGSTEDSIFGDPAVYYAARERYWKSYFGFYERAITPSEIADLDYLIVDPRDANRLSAAFSLELERLQAENVPQRVGFLGLPYRMGFLSLYDYRLAAFRVIRNQHTLSSPGIE